eukprot:5948998-Prorocentrum_lima.AAC.1
MLTSRSSSRPSPLDCFSCATGPRRPTCWRPAPPPRRCAMRWRASPTSTSSKCRATSPQRN